MNTKEKHIRENESRAKNEVRLEHEKNEAPNADMIADSLKANGKKMKRRDTFKTNKLWLWLGVIVLIFILLYWLFGIGTLGDTLNWFNG